MASEFDPVTEDPFFGIVRRRHPDVDIVLLPPERGASDDPPPDDAPALGAEEFTRIAARDLAELEARAQDCAGGHPLVQESDEGWVPSSDGRVSRRRLFAAHEIEVGDGIGLIDAAAAVLAEDGWQVQRPTGGQARLLARRGSLSLRLVHVPATRRLAVITRAGTYRIDAGVAERLLADDREKHRGERGVEQ